MVRTRDWRLSQKHRAYRKALHLWLHIWGCKSNKEQVDRLWKNRKACGNDCCRNPRRVLKHRKRRMRKPGGELTRQELR